MSCVQVKVLSMLHHPNIVTYYDSFEEDGILMIEMEYADGGYCFNNLIVCNTVIDTKEPILTLYILIYSS